MLQLIAHNMLVFHYMMRAVLYVYCVIVSLLNYLISKKLTGSLEVE
jgi:hypothetical protein